MKYAVSDEGVQALQGMATAISNSKDEISSHAQQLKAAGEGPDLGPHAESIISAAEMIEQAINGAADPLEDIAETLNDVADSYEDIIGNDRIGRATGDTECGPEKTYTNEPNSSGERAPSMPAAGAEEWARAFPDAGGGWDNMSEVPFGGSSPLTQVMSSDDYSIAKEVLSQEEMGKLDALIQSGSIRVETFGSDDDDPKPPVKEKVLRR